MNDRPIHLTNYSITDRTLQTDPSVLVPVWITQSSLDGLNALIHVLEGFEKNGQGTISGSFELVMFYRTLRESIIKAEALQNKHTAESPQTGLTFCESVECGGPNHLCLPK